MNGKFEAMEYTLLKDILKWDVYSWSDALIFWERNIKFKPEMKCLALGECNGGLSLWLALKGCDVICSDLENTERVASPLHESYKVRNRIKYQDIDALNIPYENEFDIVIFKSILGCIGKDERKGEQKKVFGQVLKALKPGGKLLFAENMKGSIMHSILRKYFTNWGSTWRYLDCSDINDFLKPFSKADVLYSGFWAVFGKFKFIRKMFFILDKKFFNNIVPKDWKYIVYVIAEK